MAPRASLAEHLNHLNRLNHLLGCLPLEPTAQGQEGSPYTAGRTRADQTHARCWRHPGHPPQAPACRQPPHKGKRPRPPRTGKQAPHTPELLTGKLTAGPAHGQGPAGVAGVQGAGCIDPLTGRAYAAPAHGHGARREPANHPRHPTYINGVDALFQACMGWWFW
uniref:Uncharacterized protein n=1 Tax=Caldiarchaeum subterraneum TaxID=311458 RepID=E6N428_CALS0|nr:hypothetical protein HGMM_F51C10C02 [Candidatus Caldarchaeum subterraneum]